MEALFRFLAGYEIYIYVALGLGILGSLRWLLTAYQEWRNAYFGLERQIAARHLSSAIAVTGLLGMFILSELCIASFIVPGLPSSTFQLTPTVNLLITPMGTLQPAQATAAAANPGSVVPFGAVGCTPNQIVIISPAPGEGVSKTVEVKGTVDVANFGFYKYEIANQGNENWATISAGDKTVINGTIGFWETSQLTPGDYQLRLIVTDNEGQELPACIIPVQVTTGN